MWTIVFLGFAALLWLMELALSPQGMASDSALHGIDRVALGFASLAGAQLLMSLLYQLIRRGGAAGRTIRSDLLRTLLAAVVYLSVFFLYVHFGLGFDVTALLATSAVLSLVVGLALQATLGNLFAGVSIELEHSLQVGDYVRRGSLAGEVLSLGWRSIHMRSDAGSILVVPNSSVTSEVLEVIPEGQSYRHEIDFTVPQEHAPGLVMQIATRVLRSGMPGVSEPGLADVIYRGVQPESGASRYTARLHVAAISQRNAIGSSVLERVWYELARLDERGPTHERASEAVKSEEIPWQPLLRSALASESPDLEASLLKSAQVRRYARQERYAERGISLIVEGSLSECRNLADAAAEVKEVLAAIAKTRANVMQRGRLDYDSYHHLKTLGINYVGPMADRLCQRIAAATDDPWVAYQVFAAFIRDSAQRDVFLTQAPRESLRLMRAGSWLGMAPHPTDHDVLRIYRAHENCTLLSWSAEEFRATFDASPGRAASPLASLLAHREPGVGRGIGSNLRG